MKVLKRLSVIILLITVISSCNIQNGFFQKRKYQKGYHISLKNRINSFEKTTVNEEMAVETTSNQKHINFISEAVEIEATLLKNKKNSGYQPLKSNKWLKVQPSSKKLKINLSASKELRIKNVTPKIMASKNTAEQSNSSDDDTLLLLYILAVLIPFVAVGIVTDWDLTAVLINILLTFLCYIPGVIHAFIKIRNNY